MPGTASEAQRNPWVTRGGIALFVMLALGLVLSVGRVSAQRGYGDPNPSPTCGGYHQQNCDAEVGDVGTKPERPRAGKGFTVTFTTTSGGNYSIKAKRKGASKSKLLSEGLAGIGDISVKHLGKKLKPGTYAVSVVVTAGTTTDKTKHSIRIRKK